MRSASVDTEDVEGSDDMEGTEDMEVNMNKKEVILIISCNVVRTL